jgi:hypothetical protein
LNPQRRSEDVETEDVEILVKVTQPRRQRDRFNAGVFCALQQDRHRRFSGGIVVADNIEPAQAQWEDDRGEVIGGKC